MFFTHDLSFYTDKAKTLDHLTEQMQLGNPARRYIVIKKVIDKIDETMQILALEFQRRCGGRAMGKTYFQKMVKPLVVIRHGLFIEYHKCKPQDPSAGTMPNIENVRREFIVSDRQTQLFYELRARNEIIKNKEASKQMDDFIKTTLGK